MYRKKPLVPFRDYPVFPSRFSFSSSSVEMVPLSDLISGSEIKQFVQASRLDDLHQDAFKRIPLKKGSPFIQGRSPFIIFEGDNLMWLFPVTSFTCFRGLEMPFTEFHKENREILSTTYRCSFSLSHNKRPMLGSRFFLSP